jgi:hypothetical protein
MMSGFAKQGLRRLAIVTALAAGVLGAASPAQAHRYGHARVHVVIPPDAVCRYEPTRRGYGPTLQYMFVHRCYVDGVLWRPGRYHRRAVILRSKG